MDFVPVPDACIRFVGDKSIPGEQQKQPEIRILCSTKLCITTMALFTEKLLAFLVAFLLLVSITGEKINLPWCKPEESETGYEPRVAKEGDILIFEWGGEAHDVWIYPSGECLDFQGREYLGEKGGASYTFTAEDVGTTKTFMCSISNHCSLGQLVAIDVVAADASDVEYTLSTPCGVDAYLGEPPIETPASGSGAGILVLSIALGLSNLIAFLVV